MAAADSTVAVSAAGSMAVALRDEVLAAGASRDEVSQAADLAAPASREAAPWPLVVQASAASVWSGDLAGAVPHGEVPHGAERAGAVAGDGAGLLRLASPLVSSLLMPGTGGGYPYAGYDQCVVWNGFTWVNSCNQAYGWW